MVCVDASSAVKAGVGSDPRSIGSILSLSCVPHGKCPTQPAAASVTSIRAIMCAMTMTVRALGTSAALVLSMAGVCTRTASAQSGPTPQELAQVWDAEHVSPPLPPLVDHPEVMRRLNAFAAAAPDLFTVEQIGSSVEGRSINDVRVGTGPLAVLLWSQMHGDEATATSALFDLFAYLTRHRADPPVQRLLSRLTLHVV